MKKTDKLRSEIKNELDEVRARLNSLNSWVQSGYLDKPCIEHVWQATGLARDTEGTSIYETFQCPTCGMTKRVEYKIHSETLSDVWSEFRDIEEE